MNWTFHNYFEKELPKGGWYLKLNQMGKKINL